MKHKDYKSILALWRIQHLSIAEIAAKLQIPEYSVRHVLEITGEIDHCPNLKNCGIEAHAEIINALQENTKILKEIRELLSKKMKRPANEHIINYSIPPISEDKYVPLLPIPKRNKSMEGDLSLLTKSKFEKIFDAIMFFSFLGFLILLLLLSLSIIN
jgi:hypothetical protein